VTQSRVPANPSSRATQVVGVLGGIASGKSEVARLLAGPDGVVIDADRLAHEELASEPVRRWLEQRIGPGALKEGSVDRAVVASRVFASPDLRRELEALVHPRVREAIRARLGAARAAGAPRVVLDVPLLLENDTEHHLGEECDALVFVQADTRFRSERAAAQRGWSPGELARREESQLPLEVKRARADFVVENQGDLGELRERVERLLPALAGRRRERSTDPRQPG
jgi:dephospho-CoA kinase